MEVLRIPSSSDLKSQLSMSPLRAFFTFQKPEWRPDAVSDECLGCGCAFSFLNRRHHCRACGELVCADCSPSTAIVAHVDTDRPVRVCKQCRSGLSPLKRQLSAPVRTFSGSEDTSSDGEPMDTDVDDEVLSLAIDLIAGHALEKKSVLCYDYFVQSEAVSWIADSGIVTKRRMAVAVFTRLVEDEFVAVKPWSGSHAQRTVFYRLNNGKCADGPSQHNGTMHAQTHKCRNCQQWYLDSMTPAPGFCSIDCKTNAVISQADSARVRKLL